MGTSDDSLMLNVEKPNKIKCQNILNTFFKGNEFLQLELHFNVGERKNQVHILCIAVRVLRGYWCKKILGYFCSFGSFRVFFVVIVVVCTALGIGLRYYILGLGK